MKPFRRLRWTISERLHDRRARKFGLTFMQIIGGDCARCGKAFGDGRYPSLYSPAPGIRAHACYGGCGPKPTPTPIPVTYYDGEDDAR